MCHIIKLSGRKPNLRNDSKSQKLIAGKKYDFDFDNMRFFASPRGHYGTNHIKFLRLGFSNNSPHALNRIDGNLQLIKDCELLIKNLMQALVGI